MTQAGTRQRGRGRSTADIVKHGQVVPYACPQFFRKQKSVERDAKLAMGIVISNRAEKTFIRSTFGVKFIWVATWQTNPVLHRKQLSSQRGLGLPTDNSTGFDAEQK